jgi:hypothetical protein
MQSYTYKPTKHILQIITVRPESTQRSTPAKETHPHITTSSRQKHKKPLNTFNFNDSPFQQLIFNFRGEHSFVHTTKKQYSSM